MAKDTIHPAQACVLRELLFVLQARFAELQIITGLSSDAFNFHMRQLLRAGWLEKQTSGTYRLTAVGKEYANRLNSMGAIEQQPKVSVMLNVERMIDGTKEFLIQQRLKSPHRGFYGRLSGKIRCGESFADAAQRVLAEETGLQADFTFAAIHRKSDYSDETATLLEDKIFIVMQAEVISGTLLSQSKSGHNKWMTREAFLQLDPAQCFGSLLAYMNTIESDEKAICLEEKYTYKKDQY
ncbi:MAG: NUDIX hydrolase [Candidatus Saccharimonadales bacterium]